MACTASIEILFCIVAQSSSKRSKSWAYKNTTPYLYIVHKARTGPVWSAVSFPWVFSEISLKILSHGVACLWRWWQWNSGRLCQITERSQQPERHHGWRNEKERSFSRIFWRTRRGTPSFYNSFSRQHSGKFAEDSQKKCWIFHRWWARLCVSSEKSLEVWTNI